MDKNQNLDIQLPPGFRFHPSDEELLVHYLRNKVNSCPLPASFIAEIDLYKYNPWELPSKALFGEDEWYFFTPRERKYPNGVRPNRAAGSGYWKATGADKPILITSCGTESFGLKKALVFYNGRPPNGCKTDWIMHEYRLHDSMNNNLHSKQTGSMRLDEWVLCRVRLKTNSTRSPLEYSNDHSNEASTSEFQQVNGNFNQELVEKCVFSMLPYVLPSKSTMPNSIISMGSSTGFGLDDGIKAQASEQYDKLNSVLGELADESLLINPMKRKLLVEENQILDLYDDSSPNKKLIISAVQVDDKEKQMFEREVRKGYSCNNFDH